MNSLISQTPTGPGSVAGAPNLPAGFAETFSSRYVDANGLRQHVVIGGDGPPLLLVHGWPQTWYQWRRVMPALARDFTVIAVDQRGIGLTDKPATGYDTGTLANDLVALMDVLGYDRFAMVGFDTGMPIGYALGADHPERLDRLVVGEAFIPGVSPARPLIQPPALNDRLYHLAFNQLAEVNEQLVSGHEDVFFGSEYAASAGTHQLPAENVRYYIEGLTDPDALRGSFGWYRAIADSIPQNEQRSQTRLTLPILAIGGAQSAGEGPADTMKLVANDVRTVVIPDTGHWLAEQAPDATLAALTEFLAPYAAAVRQAPGLWRTDLQEHDLSVPGRRVIQNRVDIGPEAPFVRHKHPGEEIIYVLEGSLEYQVDGREPAVLKAGDVLLVPPETVHAVRNVGTGNAAELATYVVEKDKPFLQIVP
jgi:pimeloyl-ACP methyl ester carboxylesterase/mannose-6-phosphate isomerase-like protein (cupin superfamily)